MPLKARGINTKEINSKIDEIRALLQGLNIEELKSIFSPPSNGQPVIKFYVKNNKLQVQYEE